MKRVLIISPHFPPVNAADMHRVRQSLPYFREFGWEPVVFAVEPDYVEMAKDDLLLETVPADVEIHQVKAFPTKWTRKVGLGNLGIRCWWQLRWAVDHYLATHKIDLIYFSTTVFVTMSLGPHWKKKFGVPFVIDLQDPWRNDYYLQLPRRERPKKFWFDYRLNSYLEARTMPETAGIISVSRGYCETLIQRYPAITNEMCVTLPFGALAADFESAAKLPGLRKDKRSIEIVYIGRGGEDMALALKAIFSAFKRGLAHNPEIFEKVHFDFVGTSYAPAGKGRLTIAPLAREAGIDRFVTEDTDRLPYFQSLKRLLEADLLFIPGSTDTNYTASKLYPYILAGKPLLVVFNEKSSVVEIVRETRSGEVVTFANDDSVADLSGRILTVLQNVLERLPFKPETDWVAFAPYTAKAMTENQCRLFDTLTAQGGEVS